MRQRDFDQIAYVVAREVAFAAPEEVAGIQAVAGALRESWTKQNGELDKARFDDILAGRVTDGIW